MKLLSVRIASLGPFDDLSVSFASDDGTPKSLVVLLGGGGVGKTTVLSAIASTRPGYAVAMTRPRARATDRPPPRPLTVCDYHLGDDDPARPHPLRIASPMAELGETDAQSLLRRREQALFDKTAELGGFALVAFSAARWFSRSAMLLSAPERNVLRHDSRAMHSFDDATRSDLTRETKQVLVYSAIAAALSPRDPRFAELDAAVRSVLATLLPAVGVSYEGVDPTSLEPIFDLGRATVAFDDLPTHARHIVALGALTVRALAAAYPERDPAVCEGVALIDDVAAHLPAPVAAALPELLQRALPRVQWILTTASPVVASRLDEGQVVALRRLGADVEVFEGMDARLH